MAARRTRVRRAMPGFTLLEALLALIILGVIMSALSFALPGALSAYRVSSLRQEDAGAARAVFGALSRDLQNAFISQNSQETVFSTGSASLGLPNTSLLALSTLTQRIQNDDQNNSSAANPGQLGAAPVGSTPTTPPQSDCALVRYDFDPNTGTVSRLVSTVPDLQGLAQMQTGIDSTIARNVTELSVQFWDANAQSWRSYWDYEPSQQSGSSGAASGGSSATGSSGATGNSGNQDATLPSAVQVSLTLRRSDGTTATYQTTIPIVTPQPLSKTSTTVATPGTSGGSSGSSGGTGGSSGGNPGGSGNGSGSGPGG